MLVPPGGAARENAMRLRHRAAPREPKVSNASVGGPAPEAALASRFALTCTRPLFESGSPQVCPNVGVA